MVTAMSRAPSPAEPPPTAVRPRRSPRPDERQRDADRSQQLIITAARTEFAAKGFAGARVAEIAQRAGVNKQLITYYFGGKEGLYQAVLLQWHELENRQRAGAASLEDLVIAYLRANHDQPELVRMLLWEGLTQDQSASETAPDDVEHSLTDELAALHRRQSDGELDTDLDPAFVLLALMGAVAAGTTMPHVVRQLCGMSATSEEFLDAYGEQLRRIVRHLQRPSQDLPVV